MQKCKARTHTSEGVNFSSPCCRCNSAPSLQGEKMPAIVKPYTQLLHAMRLQDVTFVSKQYSTCIFPEKASWPKRVDTFFMFEDVFLILFFLPVL
jgi:hypothetical protein